MEKGQRQKRPRRGRFKRRFSLALGIVLALGIAFVVLTKSRLVPYQMSKYINEHMLEDSRFTFSCRSITGDLVKRVVLHHPVVRYHGDDASYNVFLADRIAIDYSITGVFRLNLVVQDLSLENVRLQIRQDAGGRLILPVPVEGEPVAASGALAPHVEVQKFNIDGLSMMFGGGEHRLAVKDVNLAGSYQLERGAGRLRIDRGSAYIIDSETTVQSFQLDVSHEKRSVGVRDFAVRLGRSLVMAHGDLEGGRFKEFRFIFNPVALEEIHALGVIPDLEGELGGDVTLDGGLDSLSMDGAVTGTGFGMVMNDLRFHSTIASDGITFDKLAGQVNGTTLDGAFWYGWGERKGFGYDGKFRVLDLVNSFLPSSGLPEMNLNGEGSIVRDGEDRYTISAELDSALIDRYQAGRGVFEAVWQDSTGLRIDTYRFERPGYTVEGSGHADPQGNFDVLFTAAGGDLSYFWDYTSLPCVEGAVNVGGRVAGPVRDLQINLNGTVRDVQYLIAAIDSAVVQAEIRGVGGDEVSGNVDVVGRTVRIAGQEFNSPHLSFASEAGTTVIRDFSFARGDTFTTMDFDVIPAGDDTDIRIKHLEITMPDGQWRNRAPSTLTVGEGEYRLDSLVLASGNSVVGLDGVYTESDSTVDVSGWGTEFELALLKRAFELPIRFEGKSNFRARIHGEIDNPHASLSVGVRRGAVDSLDFDDLRLRAGFADGRWRVDDFHVVMDGDSLSGSGWWALGTSPVAVLAGRGSLGDGVGQPLLLEIASHHFPVPAAMAAVHAPAYVGGAFTGTVTIENTIVDPHVYIAGTVEPRGEGGAAGEHTPPHTPAPDVPARGVLRLPETTVRITHRDGEIGISEVFVSGINATLSGFLPVGINLLEGLEPRTDEPLRLELDLASADVAPLVEYSSRLSGLSGSAGGRVTVTGTLAQPVFGGRVTFNDGRVRFADLDELYTDIHAEVDLHENIVELTSIRGKSRAKDAFSGTGYVEFDGFRPSDYRLEITFSDFWVKRIPDFEALLDGRLTVATHEEGDRRIPDVTGRLTIKQAEILYKFESTGKPSPVTLPTASPGWICSIDLDAHKNLWVRNPDLNVELGGQLIVKRDQQGLYLRGDLLALRGTYTVYNNKFHVVEGSLDFSAAVGIRPEVYINAYTPYRVEDGQERRIYLTLRWPRDKNEPEIQLSSDEPGYYESDLWRMLGGTDIAGGLAANTLEKLLNQQMSGMTIYVDRTATGRTTGGTPEQSMTIGVGKYLWEDLYLTYRQGLTMTADQAVEMEYRLRNMIYIRSSVIRHSNPRYYGSILRSTDEYNLDVKLRWEY